MAEIAKKYQDEIFDIKKDIKRSYDYFLPNYERYHAFTKFTFDTALTDDDRAYLQDLGKPTIEANMGEAYISRLCGEFATQEPSMEISATSGSKIDPGKIQLVEGITKGILNSAKNDNIQYNIYRQMLYGGFSACKVFNRYVNHKSFDQEIYLSLPVDPTLVGFDMNAQESHKGDGQFCFEIYPKHRDWVKETFGNDAVKDLKFQKNQLFDNTGFNWTYKIANDDIIVLCDYYKKKRKKSKIVELITGEVLTIEEYEEFVARWESSGMMGLPPPVINSRESYMDVICRYRMSGDKLFKRDEMDYRYLPYVFFDSNSAPIRDGNNGAMQQMTRPYLYQARGMQRLINFSMQTVAADIEDDVRHKFMIEKDAIDENYIDALTNIQKAQVVVYKGFKNNDPNVRLTPPQAVPKSPPNPHASQIFNTGATILQQILGNYDAALGVNQNELSGIAIENSATQSNATAMPCIVGYLKGLNQVANIIIDLIPKYIIRKQTMPVVLPTGKTQHITVNQSPDMLLDYDSSFLNVKVEAGVNFQVQQQKALKVLVTLMKESPIFAQFINEEGLEVLLDNIDIRGIDQLKVMVAPFTQRMKQQKEQAQKMAMQSNPTVLKEKELSMKAQQNEIQNELEAARINNEQEGEATKRMLALAEIGQMTDETTLKANEVQAENARTAVMMATEIADKKHRHALDLLKMHHSNKNNLNKSDDNQSKMIKSE